MARRYPFSKRFDRSGKHKWRHASSKPRSFSGHPVEFARYKPFLLHHSLVLGETFVCRRVSFDKVRHVVLVSFPPSKRGCHGVFSDTRPRIQRSLYVDFLFHSAYQFTQNFLTKLSYNRNKALPIFVLFLLFDQQDGPYQANRANRRVVKCLARHSPLMRAKVSTCDWLNQEAAALRIFDP